MATEAENEALAKAFSMYKSARGGLSDLLVNVEKAYSSLEMLIPAAEDTSINIKDLLLNDEDKEKVKQTFQDPSIIFVGQTNSGKSSLINEVLGATVVRADDTPCTARIVEIEYHEKANPTILIRKKNNELIMEKELKKNYIPSGVANLREEDRANPDLVQSKVTAKINIPFLRCGVKIIDSPGKNENEELDSLIDNHTKSVLPLLVYVIDGKNKLTQQDIKDIGSLYKSAPEGNVFFAVTKVDPPETRCESSDDEDEERDAEDGEPEDPLKPTKLEKNIKESIYAKLVKNGFLENQSMSNCKNFHTLSSRKVKMYRRALKQPQTEETKETVQYNKRYMDDFARFKSCLVEFTRKQLIETITKATILIQASLMKCLDYFIARANTIFEKKMANEKNIKLIEAEEFLLSVVLIKTVKDSRDVLMAVVRQVVESNRDSIIKQSAEFTFVGYEVPKNGYIARDSVSMYLEELRKDVVERIGELIHREVVNKCTELDAVFDQLSKRVTEVQDKMGGQIPIHDALHSMFISNYKFDINKVKLTPTLWQRIKKGFVRFIKMKPITEAIQALFKMKVKVDDKVWKENVAKEILEVVHPDYVADAIIKGIVDHLQKGHDAFTAGLKDLRELVERSHNLGDRDRALIRQMSPMIGRLQLDAWNIIDRLRFGKITPGKIRGKGAQGVVQDCDALGPNGESCVTKMIKVESEEEMGEIALEIHYTRKFDNPNIAKVFGTMYEPSGNNMFDLWIIMPQLECDLLVALPKMKSLKLRLQVAMQVAQALLYLHNMGMMHRDIKAANVLLDKNNSVKITDFGLCKPEGIGNLSFVGTPVHMAPEIIKQQLYSSKVDVYSFGILLWYICEGGGNHPRYVMTHRAVQGLLVETAVGRRPERLSYFREDCWVLMEKCWASEPILRPSMEDVIKELTTIISIVSVTNA